MSMLTAERPLTAQRVGTLPRVNLLPPEIEEQARLRRVKLALGAVAVAAVAGVGGVYFLVAGQVGEAQQALDEATAVSQQLQREKTDYDDVPKVYAQVDAARERVSQAMGKEVRWSYFLNDLSLTIPRNVWLTEMEVALNEDSSPAQTGAAGSQPVLQTGVGTVKFKGKALRHNDVAAWLDSLAKHRGYVDPFFTKSEPSKQSTGVEDGRPTVLEFESSTTPTKDAFSGRYTTDKAGS